MATTWRDRMRESVPTWLRSGVAEKLLYAIGVQVDALTDAASAAVKLRMPGVYSSESLALLGRERRIRRGPRESSDNYAERLDRWLIDHQTRGGPYALLNQLHAFYSPNNFQIRLVYRSGRCFDMAADGTITRSRVTWSPDNQPEKWARWWLIYSWPTTFRAVRTFGEPGLKFDDGSTTYGSGLSSRVIYTLRVVPQDWNAAHAFGHIKLVHGAGVYGFPPRKFGDGLKFGGVNTAQIEVP